MVIYIVKRLVGSRMFWLEGAVSSCCSATFPPFVKRRKAGPRSAGHHAAHPISNMTRMWAGNEMRCTVHTHTWHCSHQVNRILYVHSSPLLELFCFLRLLSTFHLKEIDTYSAANTAYELSDNVSMMFLCSCNYITISFIIMPALLLSDVDSDCLYEKFLWLINSFLGLVLENFQS